MVVIYFVCSFHLSGVVHAYQEWLCDWMENDSGANRSFEDVSTDLKEPWNSEQLRIVVLTGKYLQPHE